ncbi:hypothetical protein [Rubellimicrobium sp. CFH 75288]|uniref:hypothetical protein n=1 Tax=Rubellimicrobium sp. CFH 75288 TaxID=2697034 RepID=UPI00352B7226
MPILSDLSDTLLAAGALAAALYCLVLSRRLRRFTDLERGVGGAVAILSAQVDDLTRALGRADGAARDSAAALAQASDRAEAAGRRLELMLAALHDLPQGDGPALPVFVRHPEAAGRRP